MKVLIVGLGYAGTRFRSAFANTRVPMEFSYVGRTRKDVDIPYFPSVSEALRDGRPDVVVVTVPDTAHAGILAELDGYDGFVVAEKPLAIPGDDLAAVGSALGKASGFCLDLVERYSEASRFLRTHVLRNGLELVRAHFTWGKDRINDHRPTSGVQSEIVHPLDLVQWIAGRSGELVLESALGTCSDFSVSGPRVLDSVALSGTLGPGTVTGYSSFVNITRKREVDFVFRDAQGDILYAALVLDTPVWDADRLRLWRRASGGDEVIHELDTGDRPVPAGSETVVKLGRMALDVTEFVVRGRTPEFAFPGIADALALQHRLNEMDARVRRARPVTYFPHGRTVLQEADRERLG
ncbi:Gfo/Idh/MocA family oxidoreductase [Streptomyces sp. NPDC079020]|uniref:Gfo/Idh/MocA family oxidoreductase n=1 Tax=Streptomyces sp. NPDC079020 TaxID=3365722 RepID=UPI0037D56194